MNATTKKYVDLFLGIVVIFYLVGALWSPASSAGNSLQTSMVAGGVDATTAGFFNGGGIIFKLVAIGLMIYFIYQAVSQVQGK